ncbi:MAG: HK97 gp10 family phage protein [Candidatus Paceibacterota bacterium]|jgi:hypothetical protein
MNIKIEGMDKLNSKLKLYAGISKTVTAKSLKKDLQDLQNKSSELAPYDLGDLAGSSDSDVKETFSGVEGFVSFDTPYATVQHEDLTYRHEPGKQSKYLEQPLKENIDRYVKNLGEAIRKAIK